MRSPLCWDLSELSCQAVLKSSGARDGRSWRDIVHLIQGRQGTGDHCKVREMEEGRQCVCVCLRRCVCACTCGFASVYAHTFGLCVFWTAKLVVRFWMEIWGNEQGKREKQNLDTNTQGKDQKEFSRYAPHTCWAKGSTGVLMMCSGADLHLSFKCCKLWARLSGKHYCNAFSHQDAGPFVCWCAGAVWEESL